MNTSCGIFDFRKKINQSAFSKTAVLLFFFFTSVEFSFSQQWGDYSLYSVMNSTSAYLVDTNGTQFHSWTNSGKKTGYSCHLLPGGYLLKSVAKTGNSFTGGPICGEVIKVDWNGNIVWDYIYSTTTYCSHHDIRPMPNGNVLLIAYELKTPVQVTQAGSTTNITMWPDKIVEIEPNGATGGNVVWEWRAWDHLVQNVDSTKDNYQTSIVNHPELLNINYQTQKDWIHMNGVDYNDSLDQITFSSHYLNEIYVIDHSTTTLEAASHSGGNSGKGGDILYRWGNPAAYGAAGSATLKVVHDAHWIKSDCPNAGFLVGFNNQGISNNQSCVDMVDPPYNGYNYSITPGSAFLPASYTNRIPATGYTSNMGNSQQLPNGNSQICVALSGLIYEVDANNTTIWTKNVTGSVPKSFRYSACDISGTPPPAPTISQTGNMLNSSVGMFYQWYKDGNALSGATSSSYTTSANGSYQVSIKDTFGCASPLSAPFVIGATGLNEISMTENLKLFPNPSTGMIYLSSDFADAGEFEIQAFDACGKLIFIGKNAMQINLSSFENGLYFISVQNEEMGKVTQKVIITH